MSFLLCGRTRGAKKKWRCEAGVRSSDGTAGVIRALEPPDLVVEQRPPSPSPSPPAWDADLVRIPSNPAFEMLRESFVIDRITSEGFWGASYLGHFTPTPDGEVPVTIKTTHRLGDAIAIDEAHEHEKNVHALLREIRILSNIGQHENIVNMVGAHTNTLGQPQAELYLAVELCNGSPSEYLQTQRGFEHVARWAAEIALGMEFLSQRRLVHRDLAMDNIFLSVDSPPRAKVGGLGMARVLPVGDAAMIDQDQDLQIRWMHAAIESMSHNRFSEASDVWAYGVTIWELLSFRKLPYGDIHFNSEFIPQVVAGLRPAKPENLLTDTIYNMMELCWCEYPQLRPTFTELRNFFQTLDDEDLGNLSRFIENVYGGRAYRGYLSSVELGLEQ